MAAENGAKLVYGFADAGGSLGGGEVGWLFAAHGLPVGVKMLKCFNITLLERWDQGQLWLGMK
jgi:hypothetical protein